MRGGEGMLKRISFRVAGPCVAIFLMCSSVGAGQLWWQKWSRYPKVPRVTAGEVKTLMLSGQKMIFVYAGYKVKEVVCGSLIIPYTLVPPYADGSKVKLHIPKNYWIMCY